LAPPPAGGNDDPGRAARTRDQLRITPEQTISAVEPAGPKFSQLVELPPYHYAAIFQRAPFQGASFAAKTAS
jgi:hypothetical protein